MQLAAGARTNKKAKDIIAFASSKLVSSHAINTWKCRA